MNVQELVGAARDTLSVKRVFGEPYERDGVTLIPAATFAGGGGGGGDNSPSGGSGGGMGLAAKPAGVYVIRNGDVSWQPAVDINRMVQAGVVAFVAGLLAWRSFAKTRAKRRKA